MRDESNARVAAAWYALLILVGMVLVFPIVWMFFGSFKENKELFGSLSLLPKAFDTAGFVNGWRGTGQLTFATFFKNSFLLVIPTTIFTILSSTFVAYGFARFRFPMRDLLFGLMIATLMLPNAVLIIPRYLLFNRLKWLDTYNVFYIPALFGCYPFFIFMFVQFFRGLPIDLDEAARIDGCNSFTILYKILLPLCKPVIVSGIVFQASWMWEEFFNPLIFISSSAKFPVSLGLRMSLDTATKTNYNNILAMATLSILPCAILFFCAQKYFVEGISTTGMKG